VFVLVSRPRDYGKERCIRLIAFVALLFPFVEAAIRNSGKITRGLLIATLLNELDNAICEFVVELGWSSALFHFSTFSTEVSNASTESRRCLFVRVCCGFPVFRKFVFQ
jgi:hypothetical protein